MHLLIDRQSRDALYDACACDIEGCSDLRIGTDHGREAAHTLHQRLRYLGPLLDQIGWQQDDGREVFEVDLNVRRARPFLRRHLSEMQALLEESVTTEAQLDDSLAEFERHAGIRTSPEERAAELAELRERVDRDLEQLGAYRRLLHVLDGPPVRDLTEAVA